MCEITIFTGVILITGCQTIPGEPFVPPNCDLPDSVITMPVHNPIYPDAGQGITYTLYAWKTPAELTKIELYEKEDTVTLNIDSTDPHIFDVVITEGTWSSTPLRVWNAPFNSPCSNGDDDLVEPAPDFCLTHSIAGHSLNKLVHYRYDLLNYAGGTLRSHPVTYATKPYPPSEDFLLFNEDRQPAPVYVQADIAQVSDIIFIPDERLTDMTAFRDHVRLMIRDGMFRDERVRFWDKQFNFYINPMTGRAGSAHQTPENWANLTFAEAHALMHKEPYLINHAIGTLFSTEQDNRGTMLHETGHALFGLADEYKGGGHWVLVNFTNNWATKDSAKADREDRCKKGERVYRLHNSAFKICSKDDQMKHAGLVARNYDKPCQQRVEYTIIDNAGSP